MNTTCHNIKNKNDKLLIDDIINDINTNDIHDTIFYDFINEDIVNIYKEIKQGNYNRLYNFNKYELKSFSCKLLNIIIKYY